MLLYYASLLIINASFTLGNVRINAILEETELPSISVEDQIKELHQMLCDFLFSHNVSGLINGASTKSTTNEEWFLLKGDSGADDSEKSSLGITSMPIINAELFLNKSRVHLPPDGITNYPLQVTADYMQTALDAFSILTWGTTDDLRALPGEYMLRSARTISMMQLPREKLVAMWDVVLQGRNPITITRETLELYRPLIKYLSGKQLARLNLTDSGIINFIGTHPDLNRNQMGVVASKYIQINPDWKQVKYLNNMNNLLCGFPMAYMRKVEDDVYFLLDHQAFYHVRACDRLQRRFYLNMVTRSRGMGKSTSWTARDVSRLGLLMVVVNDVELGRITPEAMSGLSSYVMVELHAEALLGLSDMQIKYLKPKARNILAQKLKKYLKVDQNC